MSFSRKYKVQGDCKLEELPKNITKLKVLTDKLRFAQHMNTHTGGAEWIQILLAEGKGKAFIRGLLKKDTIAVSDNYAAKDTKFPAHQHPGHEIFIVYKGVMKLNVDGEEIIVENKPYYFNASKEHWAFFEEETEYIAITIPADLDWPEGG